MNLQGIFCYPLNTLSVFLWEENTNACGCIRRGTVSGVAMLNADFAHDR